MSSDRIVSKGAASVLATRRPPKGDTDWHAHVGVMADDGEEVLVAVARVRREGPHVRLTLVSSSSDQPSDSPMSSPTPARCWLALVGDEIRVLATSVGAPLRFRVIRFGSRPGTARARGETLQ